MMDANHLLCYLQGVVAGGAEVIGPSLWKEIKRKISETDPVEQRLIWAYPNQPQKVFEDPSTLLKRELSQLSEKL